MKFACFEGEEHPPCRGVGGKLEDRSRGGRGQEAGKDWHNREMTCVNYEEPARWCSIAYYERNHRSV